MNYNEKMLKDQTGDFIHDQDILIDKESYKAGNFYILDVQRDGQKKLGIYLYHPKTLTKVEVNENQISKYLKLNTCNKIAFDIIQKYKLNKSIDQKNLKKIIRRECSDEYSMFRMEYNSFHEDVFKGVFWLLGKSEELNEKIQVSQTAH